VASERRALRQESSGWSETTSDCKMATSSGTGDDGYSNSSYVQKTTPLQYLLSGSSDSERFPLMLSIFGC